jgi:hypothetical protein
VFKGKTHDEEKAHRWFKVCQWSFRLDTLFVQFTGWAGTNIVQVFRFDGAKLPGAVTKLGHPKESQQQSPIWDDYASPDLL